MRDLDAGHVAAAQGEDLPAEDRGIAGLAGRIAPAAADGVLGVDDELDRALGRLLKLGVAREAEAFADGHRGDRVAVQVGHAGRADEQVAVGLLMLDQPLEPAADASWCLLLTV